jgi:FixJ family two-component response regulator
MPKMCDMDMVEKLREMQPGIPIVLMSGDLKPADPQEA